MSYQYEEKLREKAIEFIKCLEKNNINAQINQVRDYMIKLIIKEKSKLYGNLNIYYSPSKDKYNLKCHELNDKKIETRLIKLWNNGDPISSNLDFNNYQIYVDGSYMKGSIGYGVVILKGGEVIEEISGPVTDPLAKGSHQVGGELIATQEALKWCQNNEVDEVAIFYDLENIKKWATGEYKTNNPLTKNFKKFVNDSDIKVDWNKVKAHSGVYWNERADKLAKAGTKALGSKISGDERNDLSIKLDEKAEKFTNFLQNRGYSVEYKGICNSNCAKLKLHDGIKNIGHLNIYNTKKLHLIPKYHELRDKSHQQELEQLWNEFLNQN